MRPLRLLLAVAMTAACHAEPARDGAPPAPNTIVTTPPASDTLYTPAVMIARFREQVPSHPATFGDGAAPDRETLARRILAAFAAGDTVALARMRLDVSEFAWLYYLDSPYAQPGYALDPDVMWRQLGSRSGRGQERALRRYRGTAPSFQSLACPAPRVHGGLSTATCELRFTVRGAPDSMPLPIVERDGRVKVTGYANRL